MEGCQETMIWEGEEIVDSDELERLRAPLEERLPITALYLRHPGELD